MSDLTDLVFAAQSLLLETGGRKCPDGARDQWNRLYDALEAFDPEAWAPVHIPAARPCIACGAVFRGRRETRRYCSDRCRWTSAKREQRARESTVQVYP